MTPCDNCKVKNNCAIVEFIKQNCNRSPWVLDDYLRENLPHVSLVTALAGDLDSIVLECANYQPTKVEEDYSYLMRGNVVYSKPDKCGGCKGKGKCGK